MSKFEIGDHLKSRNSSNKYTVINLKYNGYLLWNPEAHAPLTWRSSEYVEKRMYKVEESAPAPQAPPKLPGKYIVWSPQANNPQKIHPYYEDAQEEAKRLALKHSGKEFYVCSLSSMFKAHVEVRQEFV